MSNKGTGLMLDLAESGPARKRYRIAPSGECCLRQWIKTLEDYREGITSLLKAARKAAAQ